MKAIPVKVHCANNGAWTVVGLLLCIAVVISGMAAPAHAAENPALWKHQVKGDFATVLTHLKHGLEAGQFIITAEENLSKGLENNKHLFPAGKWNSIGFDNVTAVHFCSVVFNQEVFNINMDWSVLCPFKVVAYSMKKSPNSVTIVTLRPTYLLAQDLHPKAKEIGKKIEDRIVSAVKEGLSH
ncbi:MAG TPA: hypothetical protein VJ437_01565 [Acidiferrobacterales bacterium]|nr:hypothetical protein [Acidiferrobacterales bacterium]